MRIMSVAAIASMVLMAAYAPARAERVCIGLTAQVTQLFDTGVLGGDIKVGDTISGAYVYESTMLDTNPESLIGVYVHGSLAGGTKAPFGVTLNAGGIVFRTDPNHVSFPFQILDGFGGGGDGYQFISHINIFEKSVPIDFETENFIFWQLDDGTGTALASSDLTTEPPVLTAWDFNLLGIISRNDRQNMSFSIDAHVTTVSRLIDNCAPPAQPGVFHLRGTGATANPLTLSLDDNGPTSTTAKYKDSGLVNLAGGNPWKEVGTWVGEPGAAVSMTALRELRLLLGLRNSDDQGTNFDLRAEVLKNGNVVASSADLYCLRGVTRNPNNAKVALLAFDRAPLSFTASDVVSLRVLTRMGTDGAGQSCGGHDSATGLRVYFDSTNQDARLRGASTP